MEPPIESPPKRPQVISWFRLYCAFLCFVYLAFPIFFGYLIFSPPGGEELTMEDKVMAIVMSVLCLVLFIVFLLPLLLRPRRWLWIYNLVAICFGMTSACFLPACVPLLIFWIKPEVKNYFGVR